MYIYVDVDPATHTVYVYGLGENGEEIAPEEFVWNSTREEREADPEGVNYAYKDAAVRDANRYAAKLAREHGCEYGSNDYPI
jgi:hypothetical protein